MVWLCSFPHPVLTPESRVNLLLPVALSIPKGWLPQATGQAAFPDHAPHGPSLGPCPGTFLAFIPPPGVAGALLYYFLAFPPVFGLHEGKNHGRVLSLLCLAPGEGMDTRAQKVE